MTNPFSRKNRVEWDRVRLRVPARLASAIQPLAPDVEVKP